MFGFSLTELNEELALVYNSYAGGYYLYCYYYYLLYLIAYLILELAAMNLLG